MIDINERLKEQRLYFSKGETKNTAFRINSLKKLRAAIIANEQEIFKALKADLNKTDFEAYMTEVGIVLDEIKFTIKKLGKWNRIKRVGTPVAHFKSSSFIMSEPHGVVLIMSPWNYPFQLTLAPLAGAIAGGNCVIVKPSAYSSNTSAIIGKIILECFEEKYISVIEGGRDANQELLKEKFDYIFFTGSVSVGKNVMEAAAKYLTPVTLELGGKSPCIVHRDADVDLSARRIVWGKFLNSGQTCVAPDYLYVHREIKDRLVEAMKKYIIEFYGKEPCKNDEYPKIINRKHFERLIGFLDDGRISAGGQYNTDTLQIAPTIMEAVGWEHPVMQEEIFGPILPVLEYEDTDSVISVINSNAKPLALYLFTRNKETESKILNSISFGGGCVNDTVVHLATSHMPFGGAGESGMGGYHGKWSFDTFTHKKSILKKSLLFDIKLRYAPYKNKLKLLRKLLG